MKTNLKFISCVVVIIITSLKMTLELHIGRKYEHSKEELELTKRVKIQQNKCQTNQTNIFVHSAARTSGKYYDRRQTTRQTWAKEAKTNHMNVIFVLAEPKDDITQEKLINESDYHKDILQFGFKDDYHNLTLKAIALLRWISLNCLVGDYVVKTDDDILINTKRLKTNIDNKIFQSGLTGKLFKYSKPVRDNISEIINKWYVPKELYSQEYYPPYLSGAAYVMSTDIIVSLYESAVNNSGPIIDIDDLFLTGIVPEKHHINRYDSLEFYVSNVNHGKYCGIEICRMYTISTLYGCDSVNKTLSFWKTWKQTTYESCEFFIDKLYKHSVYGTISLIIALILLVIFVLSMALIICQYYTNYRDLRWQKVAINII